MIAKAELHVHLEGSIPTALARDLAQRNGLDLPPGLFGDDGFYAMTDFLSFLAAYDRVCTTLRTARDFGIEGRIIVVCIRHLGPERALAIVRQMLAEPHRYVVGFGMGGDEAKYRPADFAPAYRLAHDKGYGCTVHAGEVVGPESVWAAIDDLPVTRIGHGVRSADDPRLMETLARRGIVLEVCPGSNIALGLYPDRAAHPLHRLIAAGVKVTLNSDDPPFFHTTLGTEYAEAGLDVAALRGITRTAIEASFADAATKARLLEEIDR